MMDFGASPFAQIAESLSEQRRRNDARRAELAQMYSQPIMSEMMRMAPPSFQQAQMMGGGGGGGGGMNLTQMLRGMGVNQGDWGRWLSSQFGGAPTLGAADIKVLGR